MSGMQRGPFYWASLTKTSRKSKRIIEFPLFSQTATHPFVRLHISASTIIGVVVSLQNILFKTGTQIWLSSEQKPHTAAYARIV